MSVAELDGGGVWEVAGAQGLDEGRQLGELVQFERLLGEQEGGAGGGVALVGGAGEAEELGGGLAALAEVLDFGVKAFGVLEGDEFFGDLGVGWEIELFEGLLELLFVEGDETQLKVERAFGGFAGGRGRCGGRR
jgi:hypothetical protein